MFKNRILKKVKILIEMGKIYEEFIWKKFLIGFLVFKFTVNKNVNLNNIVI